MVGEQRGFSDLRKAVIIRPAQVLVRAVFNETTGEQLLHVGPKGRTRNPVFLGCGGGELKVPFPGALHGHAKVEVSRPHMQTCERLGKQQGIPNLNKTLLPVSLLRGKPENDGWPAFLSWHQITRPRRVLQLSLFSFFNAPFLAQSSREDQKRSSHK